MMRTYTLWRVNPAEPETPWVYVAMVTSLSYETAAEFFESYLNGENHIITIS